MLLAVAAAGCTPTALQPDVRPVEAAALAGSWAAVEFDGRRLRHGGFTLVFAADGGVGGTIGCNSFEGRYRVSGGVIHFDDAALTTLGCEGRGFDELRGAERALFPSTRAIVSGDGSKLHVQGERRAVFRRATSSISGRAAVRPDRGRGG